tara:strand:+ start:634 stop:876 length:243 start_codon:yes stop_codon:yes gene_type:complete
MKKSELRKLIKEELLKEDMYDLESKLNSQPSTSIKKRLMDTVDQFDSIIGKAINNGELDKDTFHSLYGINSKFFEVVDRL